MELLPVAIIVTIAAVLGLVVIRGTRRTNRRVGELPLITDVADYTTGMLSCPLCGGMSFQTPPGPGRDFFALALGPFIFGGLSKSGRDLVECVTCASTYRRPLAGAYRKPANSMTPVG